MYSHHLLIRNDFKFGFGDLIWSCTTGTQTAVIIIEIGFPHGLQTQERGLDAIQCLCMQQISKYGRVFRLNFLFNKAI